MFGTDFSCVLKYSSIELSDLAAKLNSAVVPKCVKSPLATINAGLRLSRDIASIIVLSNVGLSGFGI